MSDNKLLKTIIVSANITAMADDFGLIVKKDAKENFTPKPGSNMMNYAKFSAVMAGLDLWKSFV